MIEKILKPLWAYRGFIFGSVKREFQGRYRGAILGFAWAILNPLAMILVYTVIFSQVMRAKLPGVDTAFAYSIYLCAGVLTWGLFAEIVNRSQSVFIDNANMLKKLNFPRICLPSIVVLTALTNFSIIFGLFMAFLLISGNFPGIVILAILPILAIQIIFSIGLGVMFGVLNVFFRDVGQVTGVLLQFWFWGTPIVYPISIIPERLQPWLELNPMAVLVIAYQKILVNHQWPDWKSLAAIAVVALLFGVLGMHMFRKHAGEMVDEL